MDTLINKLSHLIHKKYNKTFTPKTWNIKINETNVINVEYLANRIKHRSYKAFIIFNNLDLTPSTLAIIFVLTNLQSKTFIPTKKIALGFVTNINLYKDTAPAHVFNLLEIIFYNTKLYLKSNIKDEYRERVITLTDDVLSFYVGMYDIYMKLNTEEKIILEKNEKTVITPKESTEIDKKHLEIIKNVFLLGRSDFLENLFYNFKEIKKLSKMTYTYILHETVKMTFNQKIDELEILLTENGFMLYYNIPQKEYALKLSKIFKFFFKVKKCEYLSRKLGYYKYTRFINKVYYYCCIDIIDKFDCYKDIDLIMKKIYLDENMFYNLFCELENVLMKCLVEKTKLQEQSISSLFEEMYKKSENEIFIF